MRGSSTYDTSEMARLIDGLITSCKEAGLSASEIATPDEKRLLKERYGVDIGKRLKSVFTDDIILLLHWISLSTHTPYLLWQQKKDI